MPPSRIHLVFKTHLDIGFTDHAEKVRRLYHHRFIPQAIATGEHFYAEDPAAPKFIWTTGAWLIWDHLNTASPEAVRRLEEAIGKGLVRWHGLAFTTHSELMSPALFRAGLSYAAELDRRFGTTTRAAKMTDVPGHTLGIVPLLAEAGIRFLHIGVNQASPPPDVPEVFRWRAPSGEEVVVMYQPSYGRTHVPAELDEGLSFAHTNDNMGPQAIHQTVEVYRALAHRYPETQIRAASLEEYGGLLWTNRELFPVVTGELGDSWIHGIASDPVKTQRFLGLQRLYDDFVGEGLTDRRLAFGRQLTLVPEHTWGVDIKTFLRDETAWDRPAFEALRKTDFRFAYTEASWEEQRAYLDAAVGKLGPEDAKRAEAVMAESDVPAAPGHLEPLVGDNPVLAVGNWTLRPDPETGDLLGLSGPDQLEWAVSAGPVFYYRHETYDAADIGRHLDTYLTEQPEWAVLDHDKPGLDRAATARSASWCPHPLGWAAVDDCRVLVLEMPAEAHNRLGAPERVEYWFRPDGAGLACRIVLRNKPASRLPEAGFLAVAPDVATWSFCKMGLWHRAGREVPRGGAALQAVSAVSGRQGGLTVAITPLDTPLVGPADHPFMVFAQTPPAFAKGIRFNLYNNKWGTNFPMWWQGDFAARFRIEAATASEGRRRGGKRT